MWPQKSAIVSQNLNINIGQVLMIGHPAGISNTFLSDCLQPQRLQMLNSYLPSFPGIQGPRRHMGKSPGGIPNKNFIPEKWRQSNKGLLSKYTKYWQYHTYNQDFLNKQFDY